MVIRAGGNLSLIEADGKDASDFKDKMRESFYAAAEATFGDLAGGHIPPEGDVDEAFASKDTDIYYITLDGERIGGAVVKECGGGRFMLELFFICRGRCGKGLGFIAWKEIERLYPEAEVWELFTPYFERRNINFYVNKCGFHIVEFFNERHPWPHAEYGRQCCADGFFRFEKVMNPR